MEQAPHPQPNPPIQPPNQPVPMPGDQPPAINKPIAKAPKKISTSQTGRLTGNNLLKRNNLDTFKNYLLQKKSFTHADGTEVKITDPAAITKFDTWRDAYAKAPSGKKPALILQSEKHGEITTMQSSSPLLKTIDFGGHQTDYTGAAAAGSKTTVKIGPSDIGLHNKKYNKGTLLDAIKNNQILGSSAIGKLIIDFIVNGATLVPDLSTFPKGVFTSFRDNAGEYIGVYKMLNETANWVSGAQEAFEKHIGSPIKGMSVEFPTKSNYPLADTLGVVASFTNEATDNSIMISTKGGKRGKGAAFSIANIVVPQFLQTDGKHDVENGFMDIVKDKSRNIRVTPYDVVKYLGVNGSQMCQGVGVDVEHTEIEDFFKELPTIDNIANFPKFKAILDNALKQYKSPKANKNLESKLPIPWILNYLLHAIIGKAITVPDTMPNFVPFIRECLQQNFIKVGNSINKSSEWFTNVTWPNRELQTGGIVLKSTGSMMRAPSSNISIEVS
jgi:hypothetical protein